MEERMVSQRLQQLQELQAKFDRIQNTLDTSLTDLRSQKNERERQRTALRNRLGNLSPMIPVISQIKSIFPLIQKMKENLKKADQIYSLSTSDFGLLISNQQTVDQMIKQIKNQIEKQPSISTTPNVVLQLCQLSRDHQSLLQREMERRLFLSYSMQIRKGRLKRKEKDTLLSPVSENNSSQQQTEEEKGEQTEKKDDDNKEEEEERTFQVLQELAERMQIKQKIFDRYWNLKKMQKLERVREILSKPHKTVGQGRVGSANFAYHLSVKITAKDKEEEEEDLDLIFRFPSCEVSQVCLEVCAILSDLFSIDESDDFSFEK